MSNAYFITAVDPFNGKPTALEMRTTLTSAFDRINQYDEDMRSAWKITVVPVGMEQEALEDFLATMGMDDRSFTSIITVPSLLEVWERMKDNPLGFVNINNSYVYYALRGTLTKGN